MLASGLLNVTVVTNWQLQQNMWKYILEETRNLAGLKANGRILFQLGYLIKMKGGTSVLESN